MAFEVSKVTGYGKQTIEALKYAGGSGGTDPELEAQVAQNTTDIATANSNITNLSQELTTLDAKVDQNTTNITTANSNITNLSQEVTALDARVETCENEIASMGGSSLPTAKQKSSQNSLSFTVPSTENLIDCVLILPLLETACEWETTYYVQNGVSKNRKISVQLPAKTATTTKAYLYLKREGGCIQPYVRLNGTGADTDVEKCIVVGAEDVYAQGETISYNYITAINSSIKNNASPGVWFNLRYSYTTRS